MYVKKWFAFASMIVAASLPAYGPAALLKGCVLFRNRSQDVSVDIADL
jgi:hypothetical protein